MSEDLLRNVELIAKGLGITKKEVMSRAVGLYLRNLREVESLESEMRIWEEIGEEDSVNFFEKHRL